METIDFANLGFGLLSIRDDEEMDFLLGNPDTRQNFLTRMAARANKIENVFGKLCELYTTSFYSNSSKLLFLTEEIKMCKLAVVLARKVYELIERNKKSPNVEECTLINSMIYGAESIVDKIPPEIMEEIRKNRG